MREVPGSIPGAARYTAAWSSGIVVFFFFTLPQYNCHSGGIWSFKCTRAAVAGKTTARPQIRNPRERPPDAPLGQAGATTAREWFPKHRATRHVATTQPQRDNVRRKNERDIPELDAPGSISKRTNPLLASTHHRPCGHRQKQPKRPPRASTPRRRRARPRTPTPVPSYAAAPPSRRSAGPTSLSASRTAPS